MKTLNKQDLARVLTHIPKDLAEEMRTWQGRADGRGPLFIGGGFIRAIVASEKPSDIDLFGSDVMGLRDSATRMSTARAGRMHTTGNAYTVLSLTRLPLQYIHRWTFAEAEGLVASFDFTICQAVVWWGRVDSRRGQWMSLTCDRFYEDLAARRLVYARPVREEDAGGSLLRVRKYLQRGYGILIEDYAAVIMRVYKRVDDLRQTTDSDDDIEKRIVGELRLVDPLVPIDGLDMAHECFDDGK